MFSTESTTNHEHQFPANRAFVIQFSTNTQLSENCFNGRVENIVSGEVSHVFSVIGLLQFYNGRWKVIPDLRPPS